MSIDYVFRAKNLVSSTEAILLAAIVYRNNLAEMTRNGKLWIVHQAEYWQELTGLTRKQYRAALTHLKKQKLIETEVHKSKYHGWQLATFIHVPKGTLELIRDGKSCSETTQEEQIDVCNTAPMHVSSSAQIEIPQEVK